MAFAFPLRKHQRPHESYCYAYKISTYECTITAHNRNGIPKLFFAALAGRRAQMCRYGVRFMAKLFLAAMWANQFFFHTTNPLRPVYLAVV